MSLAQRQSLLATFFFFLPTRLSHGLTTQLARHYQIAIPSSISGRIIFACIHLLSISSTIFDLTSPLRIYLRLLTLKYSL